MIDYEFIDDQKSRLIEAIEEHIAQKVSEHLEDEISRVLHQVAFNEDNKSKK